MATRKRASASRARRGRPPAAAPAPETGDARRRLLDAAARQFAAGGFSATSLRQVAAEAEVTPAMVSYYFRDKDGLLEAVLAEGLDLVLGALEQTLAAGQTGPLLPRFVQGYLEVLTEHPWIPRIIVQEVISRDTPLRTLFVERFARRAVSLVAPMLREEMRAGRLRRDLDVRLTVMSVIGMCVFPYIAEPLLARLLDYRIDAELLAAFVPHTVALLEHGLGPAP